jgi:aromatic ring-opening dioxygenase LigB subunit
MPQKTEKDRRGFFIASADQLHTYKSGPYGFNKAAAQYDRIIHMDRRNPFEIEIHRGRNA